MNQVFCTFLMLPEHEGRFVIFIPLNIPCLSNILFLLKTDFIVAEETILSCIWSLRWELTKYSACYIQEWLNGRLDLDPLTLFTSGGGENSTPLNKKFIKILTLLGQGGCWINPHYFQSSVLEVPNFVTFPINSLWTFGKLKKNFFFGSSQWFGVI